MSFCLERAFPKRIKKVSNISKYFRLIFPSFSLQHRPRHPKVCRTLQRTSYCSVFCLPSLLCWSLVPRWILVLQPLHPCDARCLWMHSSSAATTSYFGNSQNGQQTLYDTNLPQQEVVTPSHGWAHPGRPTGYRSTEDRSTCTLWPPASSRSGDRRRGDADRRVCACDEGKLRCHASRNVLR